MDYAYTIVMQRHFFISGSLITNLDLSFFSEEGVNGKHNKISVNPAIVYWAATGYNSSTWNISANWVGNAMWLKGAATSEKYFLPMGDYALVLT